MTIRLDKVFGGGTKTWLSADKGRKPVSASSVCAQTPSQACPAIIVPKISQAVAASADIEAFTKEGHTSVLIGHMIIST
jgi:hypothetical protein